MFRTCSRVVKSWGGILPERLDGGLRLASQNPYPILILVPKSVIFWVTWKYWLLVHGPALWTGSVDYPTDHPTDYLYGPPLQTYPVNRIKIINKDFTYGLFNRFLVLVKFWALRCRNATDFGLSPQNSIWKLFLAWGDGNCKKQQGSYLPFMVLSGYVRWVLRSFACCLLFCL